MKRWIIGTVCTLVGGFVFLVIVGASVSSNKSKPDMPVSEILANLAQAAKEMKGKKVASNVVVSGATIEGERLTYMYRIPQLARNGGVDYEIAAKKSKELKREVCRNRMMRKALEGGAEIIYSYRNQAGRVVYEVEVDAADCAKKS